MPLLQADPTAVSSTMTTATVRLEMSTLTLTDPTVSGSFGLEVSRDLGVTWKPYVTAGWRGAPKKLDRAGVVIMPWVSVEYAGALRGLSVRSFVATTSSLRVGSTVSVQ